MSTKFAHVSVLGSTVDKMVKLLKSLPKSTNNFEEKVEKLLGEKNDLLVQLLTQFAANDEYYVGSNNKNWVTITNNKFSFESIDDFAFKLSENIDKDILSFAYINDDVLTFSLIKSGKYLTQHKSGAVDTYGLDALSGNTELIAGMFDITSCQKELEEVLAMDDLMEKVKRLEELSRLLLWLPVSMVRDKTSSGIKWKKVTVK